MTPIDYDAVSAKMTQKCDHFFYIESQVMVADGKWKWYPRGKYPCSLEHGHEGPHLHWDENPNGSWVQAGLGPRTFPLRSEWMTEETFGKLPSVIEYRARIAKMRKTWELTGLMPHFHEVTL